jgi:uncharacterized protein
MAVDSGEFISATVSYNVLKRQEEPLIDYAAERGVGVIIMNPLGGGMLALSEDPRLAFLQRGDCGSWYGALRFLFANKNISTAISGFGSVDEVEMNVKALENPEELTEEYRQRLIKQADEVEFGKGDLCTGCGYCKDCPEGFNPTEFMEFMRDFDIYAMNPNRLWNWLATRYSRDGRMMEDVFAKCIECGQCETKCPQKLPIVENIRRAKSTLER